MTNMARQLNARCADSRRGEFPILDVIRKGKVLTKARKYFDGNPIYKGDREDMRVKDEWMLEFRTWLREWLPKPLFNLSKAIMRRRGYTFLAIISEGYEECVLCRLTVGQKEAPENHDGDCRGSKSAGSRGNVCVAYYHNEP